ncbi:MAG: RecQ family ATP-dependent DNA helicase [Verrucomicrobiales bacterium]|nr:RecQ family ATP-dependent DNA helicase [Verrucomicrobiales bacterium]
MTHDPREALEKHFGFREFLDGQEQVVSSLLSGRDALVVMPTGGGKSLCYQLPALVMDGITIVVSPLIALMKDQVDALEKKGVAVTVINSTLSLDEQRDRIRRMREGEFKLVYVAPERFRSENFVHALQQIPIALFAVDEAHCLSAWGHDFRPDYLRLKYALEKLGHPQTAAFTATATAEVRQDILDHLKLNDPMVIVSGFERPNLSLRVRQCSGNKEKYARLKAVVDEQGTGIVYCATRKKVDEVSASLAAMGVNVIAYHGGMDDKARSQAQDQFLDGTCDVVVATNAFGMGIDRSDVRFVVHFELPGSIEAYYQEAGRAGRDGEPAVCELLFNYADTRTQEFFIEGNNPGYTLIHDLYLLLQRFADERGELNMTIKELATALAAKNDMGVGSAISTLVRAGYIERYDVAGSRAKGTRLLRPDVAADDLDIDRKALEEKERRDRAKLEGVVSFSYANECRQQWVVRYFGEQGAEPCGACDQCRGFGAEGGKGLRVGSEQELLTVRKLLSGVARMSYGGKGVEWRARFGKGKIAAMLTGSRSQGVISARLDQLSTYGILKAEGSAYVNALMKEMERVGFVKTERRDQFPLTTLTQRGDAFMRGKGDSDGLKLLWPDPGGVSSASTSRGGSTAAGPAGGVQLGELDFDETLYKKLLDKRTQMAADAGNVPAYVIFSNQTLEFFTRLRPKTREQGLNIRGVGEVKAERYLDDFLKVIKNWEDA